MIFAKNASIRRIRLISLEPRSDSKVIISFDSDAAKMVASYDLRKYYLGKENR